MADATDAKDVCNAFQFFIFLAYGFFLDRRSARI